MPRGLSLGNLSTLLPLLLLLALATAMTNSASSTGPHRITLIRHGRTHANEYLTSVSPWGSPNFRDLETLRDSKLNDIGVKQATQLYERIGDVLASSSSQDVLICVSPLSRTLETFRLGFGYPPAGEAAGRRRHHQPPHLQRAKKLALPLLSERTYMVSDVGTRLDELRSRYGHFVDFDLIRNEEWWYKYDSSSHGSYTEWRPSDADQQYLVDGEPPGAFRERMLELVRFLGGRKEEHVICVTSWGVISELTGTNPKNCDIVDNVTLEVLHSHLNK